MTRAHIQIRIWLNIAIFGLGFLLTPVVSQVERKRAEQGLADIADHFLPTAESGRDAEAAFQRVVKVMGRWANPRTLLEWTRTELASSTS